MSSVFLSFVVPCYNVRAFLPKCIESLEKQLIPGQGVEFVLVNDGSEDDTLGIIREFAARDSRVIVIDQPNQGVSAARNSGLAAAQGEYVFFLDGDDFLTDDASQAMYDFCQDEHPDIALFSNYRIREGGTERKPWYISTRHLPAGYYETGEYLRATSFLPISFKLYRRSFLNAHQITFDRGLVAGEVFTFFIHALSLSESVGVCPSYVMCYLRRRSKSAMSTIDVERDLTILDTLHTINRYADAGRVRLKDNRAFLAASFRVVTAFALIKYAVKTRYRKEHGVLLARVKQDQDYDALLKYLTGRGRSWSGTTLQAFCIRFLPPRIAYGIIRGLKRIHNFVLRVRNCVNRWR